MDKENPTRIKSYHLALQIVKLCHSSEFKHIQKSITHQLLRSATSIGANLEEASAAESTKDFIHKNSIARKEAKETHYWLRLLHDSNLLRPEIAQPLLSESDALVRITTSIVLTSKQNLQNQKALAAKNTS